MQTTPEPAISSDAKQSTLSQPLNGGLNKEPTSCVQASEASSDLGVSDISRVSTETADVEVKKSEPEVKLSKPVPPSTTAPTSTAETAPAVSEGN